MKRNWLLFVMFLGLIGIYRWFSAPQMNSESAIELAKVLRATPLKIGINANFKLPSAFAGLAVNNRLDVVRQKNGKVAYFLKSTEGFKGNYQGYIYVDSGFPFILSKDVYGRNTIDIFGTGGEYTVIDRKISNHLYAVFADLG